MIEVPFVIVMTLPVIVIAIVRKLIRKRKVLTPDSTVLITGGCMGLGRSLALTFAKNHKCNIIIYDIRADLSDDLCS